MNTYIKPGTKARKQYTAKVVARLDSLISSYKSYATEAAMIEQKLEEIRAELLELTLPAVTPDAKVVLPGVTIAERVKVTIDEQAALEWVVKRDEAGQPVNLYTAANLLKLRPDAMGLLVSQIIANPALERVLALNVTGYQAAVAKGTHADAPFVSKEVVPTLSIRETDLRTGSDLRALIDIVEEE